MIFLPQCYLFNQLDTSTDKVDSGFYQGEILPDVPEFFEAEPGWID